MPCSLAYGGGDGRVRFVRDHLILAIHLLVTCGKLLRPSGARAVAAESLLLKHQLLISNRSRQRAQSHLDRSLCARPDHPVPKPPPHSQTRRPHQASNAAQAP